MSHLLGPLSRLIALLATASFKLLPNIAFAFFDRLVLDHGPSVLHAYEVVGFTAHRFADVAQW